MYFVGGLAEPNIYNIPEGIFVISEGLLRKHHDRTGIDWQSQPVVQVHVLQPVVIHLNVNTGTLFLRNVASLSFSGYYF